MLYTVGSVVAFLTSIFIYYKPRETWSAMATNILYDFKYNVLGARALIDDFVNSRYNKVDLRLQSGKVAIVTGGSRGIGLFITKMLLKCDMEVIIACRKISAGEKARQQIIESGVTGGCAKVYELDNSSLESVRKFVDQIKKDYKEIHILINNAGIMSTPYAETKDGFEQQWGVNYLSHFLLTALLLPLLKAGGSPNDHSRVVNVSSCAHHLGYINFQDINFKNEFITSVAYAQSKLAQVMFTVSLQELVRKKSLHIQTYSVHPGIVNTDLFANTQMQKFKWFIKYIFKTPEQGATSIVYAAISKDINDHGGAYISNCRKVPMNSLALDISLRERLFQLSLDHVQIRDFCEFL